MAEGKKLKAASDRKREEQTATLIISVGTAIHVKHSSKVLTLCRGLQMATSKPIYQCHSANTLSAASTLCYSWYKLTNHQGDAKPKSWQPASPVY